MEKDAPDGFERSSSSGEAYTRLWGALGGWDASYSAWYDDDMAALLNEIEVTVGGRPHGRIVARGSGAQVRGEHPTELILDDLENREEASSEGPREKMREYFYQDLWGAVRHEDGNRTRVKIVGTFVHPLALLPT